MPGVRTTHPYRLLVSLVLPVCAGIVAAGCSESGRSARNAPRPTPVTCTLDAEVRNSTGDKLGDLRFTNLAGGSQVTLTVATLRDKGIPTGTLADGYLVARTPDTFGTYGTFVGDFIASSQQRADHTLALTITASQRLVIYGLNNTNNADYAGAFATVNAGYAGGFGKDMLARKMTVRALKAGEELRPSTGVFVVDGPDEYRRAAVDQINASLLMTNGVRLGFMDYTGDADTADAAMGYYSGGGATNGLHSNAAPWVFAASETYRQNPGASSCVFYAEGIELLLRFDNLLNKANTSMVVCNSDGVLLPASPDYVRAAALFVPTR
jgi:hypothetical protein